MGGLSPRMLEVCAGLSRRELLVWGSTCVAGSFVAAPAAARQLLGLNAPVELPMSVGFLDGSDELESFDVLPWQGAEPLEDLEVVPAERLALGDQNLALSMVEMCVHGLYPRVPPKRAAYFRGCNLVVMFPSEDPLAPGLQPVVPWGLRRLPQLSRPARVRFPVPLREDGGLDLALELIGNDMGAKVVDRYLTSFTVDWYEGRPKLQRGIYLLGLTPRTWASAVELPERDEPRRDELCSLVVSFEPIDPESLLEEEAVA